MKTVVGIDNGTQSTKVIFYDYENMKIVAEASAPHDLISLSADGKDDGTREQEASWWLAALKSCFAEIPDDIRKTARAVGVSGQQHGFVPVDKDGNVLHRVKLWCDTATARECEEITSDFGGDEKLLKEVGNLVLPGYTAGKILWFKNNCPDEYAKMEKILLPHDYLNFYLTGEYTMEPGDASGTALLNIKEGRWEAGLLEILDPDRDLSGCLPKLIKPGETAGKVSSKAASELGLPEGIPVSSGGGDNMMGAIGTGTVKDGFLTMSLGTSGTIYGYSDTPVIDPAGNLAAFFSSTGGWLPLLCTMNCTVASELMRELFDRDLKELNSLAEKSPIGSAGIITLPFFNGERTPNLPNGKGCLVGMTGSNVKEENILRSAMESAILGMKLGLDSFRALGFQPKEVRLIGGGAKSPLWRQIAADVLDLPVQVPVIEEAAAFGGALQALWTLEKIGGNDEDITRIIDTHVKLEESKSCMPNKESVDQYDDLYRTYNTYVAALTGLFQ
ncbi:MAG: xylulokinase [Spirochaetales bacterium]|nr:xylulokinase [Spirochaetales bacterium]